MGDFLKSLLHWRSSYFRRNFILILLITSIPGMITGLSIYLFGVVKLEQQLRDAHKTQIIESARNLDDQLENLEESLTYWAFDPRFDHALTRIDFSKNFRETRDINKTLRTIQKSQPLISRVELFLDLDKSILLGPYYQTIENEDTVRFYQSLLEQVPSIRWNQWSISQSETASAGELAITHLIPGVGQAFGVMIAVIDNNKLTQLLDSMAVYEGGGAFLVKDDDQVLMSTKTLNSDAFIAYIKQHISQISGEEASFLLDWEGEKYSISFGTMDRIDEPWRYVSVAPISSVIAPILFISKLIMLISAACLLLGFLLTWFASSKIYRPVKKLLHVINDETNGAENRKYKDEFEFIRDNLSHLSRKSDTLQKQLFIRQPELRRSFLLQLGKGDWDHYTEQELRRKMEDYGWELEDRQFQLIDLQVTGIYESEKMMKESDESLITFSVFNIVEEYIMDFFEQFTVINYHDMSVGIFLIAPVNSQTTLTLHHFSEGVASIINRILDLKVTVTISNPVQQATKIPHLFDEVSRGKRLRTFENKNQIIDLSNGFHKEREANVYYPFETEKAVVQAVRRGQVEEAEQFIRQFIHELRENDFQEVHIQTGIIQLFSMIQHEIFLSGIHPHELFASRNMVDELSKIRELEWMVTWIRTEVIVPYVRMLDSRMDMELKQIVEKVTDYIQEHYMEDTSLEQCAELANTNPYLLSKAFKKVLNVNYIDYLTNVRITKAKELLLDTDMKISEISEKVGYRESYFNRIFKKQVGVTASHFRKMNSSDK